MSEAAVEEPLPRDLAAASDEDLDTLVRQLYVTVGPRVLGLGYRFFGGRTDVAEDLVSETFARVILGIRGFEGRSRYSTWILRIAMNVAGGWLRTRACRPTQPLTVEPPDGGARPEDRLAADERRRNVDEAVAALGPDHRMVLSLVVLEGVSQVEAAELLGIAPGTVWSRYARARFALATELKRRGLDPTDANMAR